MTTLAFVFAKPPRPGVSKTRLARGVGAEVAAALAAAFLADTVAGLRSHGYDVRIATTEPDHPFDLDAPTVDQGGGDLGARLARVTALGLAEAPRVVLCGADSPGLPPERLVMLDALGTDAGFVPAADGGFVALSLGRSQPDAFTGVTWSTAGTCAQLARHLRAAGLTVASTAPWFDIDRPEDLARFRATVPISSAPRTWSVLRGVDA
jgi:hypothetical protein